MGRYAEEPLILPEVSRIFASGMRDGELFYYAEKEDGSIFRYNQHAGVGTQVPWLSELNNISSLSEAPGGTVYVIASDEENNLKLYYSKDGKTATIIDMPDWSDMGGVFTQRPATGGRTTTQSAAPAPDAPQGPGGQSYNVQGGTTQGGPQQGIRLDSMMIPQKVAALDDGFLISYMMGNVVQYDVAGKKMREYSSGGGMGGMGGPGGGTMRIGGGAAMAVYENTLALADTGARAVVLHDLATGQKAGTFPYDAMDSSTYIGLDKDGPLLGDAGGVYRWEEAADTAGWEMIVDGELTSLVMPTLGIEGLFDDGTGAYYAILSGGILDEGEGTQLVRFAFDESIPAEPDTTLEVFALNDSSTVRLAIGAFQRKNPNVRVRLEVGLEGGDAATTEDVVRKLNTALLAQKGPDILILDGLPIQSYIEKKVLKDITALANNLGSSLMQNLTGAYARDGKIYGLPALFGLPAMVGDKEALAQFTSLEALVQTVENWPAQSMTPTPILRASDNLYDENTGMLMDYYDACVGSFTRADGTLDENTLADYLADMLTLSDVLKRVTPQSTDQRRMGMALFVASGRQSARMDPRAIMDVAQGNALSCVQQLSGMGPLMMTFTSLGDDESMALESLFGQDQFYPRCGVGIVSASKQQKLAEEFIALLLSSDVQDSNLFDGFPVNRASLQNTLDSLKGMARDAMGRELGDMGFIALCEGLSVPLFTDETVKAAVTAELKGLLGGATTPEEAAARIVADTKLYLAE